MKKKIKQIACMLTALSLFLTVVGCGSKPNDVSSDVILGIEYIDDGSAGDDNSLTSDGNTNVPSGLEINKSSEGAKVVNNC